MMLTIIIVAIALIVILTVIRRRYDAEVKQIWQELQFKSSDHIFTQELIAHLPEPVQRYFTHAIAPGTPLANYVELEMSGNFRQQPDANWLPMEASQIISKLPGFVWQAKIGRGLTKFSGADYSDRGRGRMRFFLWGLMPLVDARNENIARSSSGRLAGEYIWLPSALLPQNKVTWQAIAENTIQANFQVKSLGGQRFEETSRARFFKRTQVPRPSQAFEETSNVADLRISRSKLRPLNNQPITLTLTIDADGRLLKMSLPRWGNRTKDGSWQYIPFGGEIEAEQTFDGYTIPAIIHAGWWFGSQDYFESFQTNIKRAKFY